LASRDGSKKGFKPNKKFPLKRYDDCPTIATLAGWPWHQFETQELVAPIPFLVAGHVDGNAAKAEPLSAAGHIEYICKMVTEALAVALSELSANQPLPRYRRERHLVIGIPVVGTGWGGAMDLTGQTVEKLLDVLREFGERESADAVLVCADGATYAHAQQIRRRQRSLYPCFELITPDLRVEASRLSTLANKGQLSLFLGAGVSVASA
jgi:hypothetical protein